MIQSNDGFSLYNLAEVRFFLKYIDERLNTPVIDDRLWNQAKERLSTVYSGSTCLSNCLKMLKEFEKTNSTKFRTDFGEFIRESNYDDFYEDDADTISVSTIHKAVLENGARRVAIEIDDETSHNKSLVASNKFYDDLLKQNSMVYLGWDVYRWAVRQMQIQPEAVKDELRVFLGSHPQFKEIEDYLPHQRGKALDGSNLELKKHQIEALKSLQAMRDNTHRGRDYHLDENIADPEAIMKASLDQGKNLLIETFPSVDLYPDPACDY